MTDEKRELVWLPADLAAKVKGANDRKAYEDALYELIRSRKLNMEQELSNLNDDVAVFRGACTSYRTALEKVVREEADKMDELAEKAGEVMSSLRKSFKDFAAQSMEPLTRQIQQTERAVEAVKRWKDSFYLTIPHELTRLSECLARMDEPTKQILRDLLDRGRQDKESRNVPQEV